MTKSNQTFITSILANKEYGSKNLLEIDGNYLRRAFSG